MNIKLGKIEITETEIQQKSLTKKRTIPLTKIKEVTYKEPGKLSGGNLTIIPYYEDMLIININKKHKEEGEQAYNYLSKIAEQNKPPIQELEQDSILNTFQCFIHEERQTVLSEKQTNIQKAEVKLYDDRITVSKIGMFSKMDKGTKTVLFQDVTSVDLDMGMVYNYIILTMAGSPGVILQQPNKILVQQFYDLLLHKFNQFKCNDNDNDNGATSSGISDADELVRWHELMEKGIITEEEFEHKKKELLGL